MTHRKVRLFGYVIFERGVGEFGPIYSGIRGQDAVNFLLRVGRGEVHSALYHHEIGHIDLVFGTGGANGYGLAHILEKHPNIVSRLHELIQRSKILQKLDDRIIVLYEPNIKSIISLTWHESEKKWLVTAYEKIPD